jgi:glutaredoxin
VRVVLVTRAGCHLCDDALSLLRELGIEPEMADVDADDALFATYDWRVPVVLADDVVIAEGLITRQHLERLNDGSGRGSAPV